MNSSDTPEALQFEPPEAGAAQGWAQAETACLKFPERFLQLARELNECRRERDQAWQERDRLDGFVVRNLITVADNCRAALSSRPPAAEAPPEGEPLEAVTVASVQRTVLHLLEEMGVVPVELLGRTYEDVVVDGEKVSDPFEVQEAGSELKGKLHEAPVREVILDLWVRRRDGTVQVVRRGRVNC